MTLPIVSAPTIGVDAELRTLIEVVAVSADTLADTIATAQAATAWSARQPGFVSATLHRSTDTAQLLNYVQWADAAHLHAAQQAAAQYDASIPAAHLPMREIARVVQTWTHDGAPMIALGAPENGVIIIDVIRPALAQQAALLDSTLSNGERIAQQPGNQAIAVLAGRHGTIITYAHWRSMAAFFRAFAALSGIGVTSMAALNQAIAQRSGGATRTDYHAYTVVEPKALL